MCLRLALLSFVFVLAACAPSSSSPVVDVPASSASMGDTAPPLAASSTSSSSPQASSASAEENPFHDPDFPNFLGTCRQSGFKMLEPCPGGGDSKIDDVDQPEIMRYCCTSGTLTRYPQMEGCFNVLEAALSCGDQEGIRAAGARINELARVEGEPCKDPTFRERFVNWPGLRRICKLRGFP